VALAYFDEAIALRAELFGERHPRTVAARAQRALVLRDTGRHDEAVASLEAVVALLGTGDGSLGPSVAEVRANVLRHLGRAYEYRGADGDLERAIDAYRDTIAGFADLAGAQPVAPHRLHGPVRFLLAAIGQRDGGDAMLAEVLALSESAAATRATPAFRALLRALSTQTLAGDARTPASWIEALPAADARDDLAVLGDAFGAASAEAFEGELALVARLVRDPSPAVRAEGAACREALATRAAEVFGADSDALRRLKRLGSPPPADTSSSPDASPASSPASSPGSSPASDLSPNSSTDG
jgi:tetratricopeptide (TPR) repeat protein